jgi:Protein of unknown function (DUF3109)
MIIIQDILVSEEIVEEEFLCNLSACKGACCWEGDAGAPLEKDELQILTRIYDEVKPFLLPEGIKAIEEQGVYIYDEGWDSYETTLVNNGPCAYMTKNELGIAQCGIERAWKAGATDFRKPISCQLYPIRVSKNETAGFEALNYERWPICSAACDAGKKAKLPVYKFLKDALIRKYGEDFYAELEAAAEYLEK